MPLEHSRSPAAFKRNVQTLMGEVGKSPHVKTLQQALAISYAIKRGRADGGGVAGGDIPVDENDTALARDRAASTKSAFDSGRYYMDASGNMQIKPPTPPPPKRASGGGLAGGGATPWYVRQEARGMHAGPIMSSVPGRTDHLPLTVGSGSYVIPSTHVASMGQGNTMAGFAALNKMFGGAGPYGAGRDMAIRHGSFPKAPSMKFSLGGYSEGGGRGDGIGSPVDIMAAGGEYVIPPETVKRIGKGDIKHGHAILDHWIMKRRKVEIKTQRKLPPPAKR